MRCSAFLFFSLAAPAFAGAALPSSSGGDAPETTEESGTRLGFISPQTGRLVIPDNEQGRALATADAFRGLDLIFPVGGATFHSIEYTETYGLTDFRNTWRRNHFGTDIFAPAGTPVLAARDGVVTIASFCPPPGPGYKIAIYHGRGVYTYYLHMESVEVRAGQPVSAGDTIGFVGATGNAEGTPTHLHFEIDFGVEAQSRPYWLIEYTGVGLRPGVALTRGTEPLAYVCEHAVRLRPPRGLYLLLD
jgi:murein DD-endopeptidase MepM/ murein hydrolase activator NlpD